MMEPAVNRRELSVLVLPPMMIDHAQRANRPAGASMSSSQALARYENAQEIIGMLIALRSQWIETEARKSRPDEVSVADWTRERVRLADELDALTIEDDQAIERILNVYGPQVRAGLQ